MSARTILQVFAFLFPAVIFCALAVRSLRPRGQKGLELWGWRLTLPGYILLGLGLATVASPSFPSSSPGPRAAGASGDR